MIFYVAITHVSGVKALWSGVKKYGAKDVMGETVTSGPNNTPPTGGTPAAVAV